MMKVEITVDLEVKFCFLDGYPPKIPCFCMWEDSLDPNIRMVEVCDCDEEECMGEREKRNWKECVSGFKSEYMSYYDVKYNQK